MTLLTTEKQEMQILGRRKLTIALIRLLFNPMRKFTDFGTNYSVVEELRFVEHFERDIRRVGHCEL
jgi:uncharacterized protein (DUF934 family)